MNRSLPNSGRSTGQVQEHAGIAGSSSQNAPLRDYERLEVLRLT